MLNQQRMIQMKRNQKDGATTKVQQPRTGTVFFSYNPIPLYHSSSNQRRVKLHLESCPPLPLLSPNRILPHSISYCCFQESVFACRPSQKESTAFCSKYIYRILVSGYTFALSPQKAVAIRIICECLCAIIVCLLDWSSRERVRNWLLGPLCL